MNVQNYMICFVVTAALTLADGVIRQNPTLPLETKRLGTATMVIFIIAYGAATIWFIISSVWLKG